MTEELDIKIWRIINTIVLAAWLVVLGVDIIIGFGTVGAQRSFLQKALDIGVEFCTVFVLIFCYFHSIRFILYSILLFLWGCVLLFTETYFGAFAFWTISVLALWRQHLINWKAIVGYIGCLVLTPSVVLVLKHSIFTDWLLLWGRELAFILLLVIAAYLAVPLWLKEKSQESKLDIKQYGLSDRQVRIAQEVLLNTKYTAIASMLNCSLSTVKKEIADIFEKLSVADRTEFLQRYAGCTLLDAE